MLKTEVLHLLEAHKGRLVTGGQLADALGVSRTAVWKAVHQLQQQGSQIVSHRSSGYELLASDDALLLPAIQRGLTTGFVGRSLELLDTVPSTNLHLKRLDAAALPSGHAVVADAQTDGRGRRGRSFVSERSEGVYLSILLRGARLEHVRLLTVCAAVAVAEALASACGIDAGIKWVNDVYAGGKKLCGILTEAQMSAELQELESVVVGIGINTGRVPDELSQTATSVLRLTGQSGVRNRLLAEVLNRFEARYLDCATQGGRRRILDAYERRLFIRGQRVRVLDPGAPYFARVLGIDEVGGLVVRDEAGAERHITTGEIELQKEHDR